MVLDEPQNADIIKEVEGIKFIIDKKLDEQFDVVTVDYQKTMFSKGFVIKLEGRTASCS